ASPGLDQLGDFLAEFPQGTHARAAADRRAALEQEQAEEEEARERSQRESEAWAAASSAGDAVAFEAFLKEWPQSQHADAARARIKGQKGTPTRRWLLQGAGGAVGLVAVGSVVPWMLHPRLPSEPRLPSDPRRSEPSLPSEPRPPAEPPPPTGHLIRTFTGHSDTVYSVAF